MASGASPPLTRSASAAATGGPARPPPRSERASTRPAPWAPRAAAAEDAPSPQTTASTVAPKPRAAVSSSRPPDDAFPSTTSARTQIFSIAMPVGTLSLDQLQLGQEGDDPLVGVTLVGDLLSRLALLGRGHVDDLL